MEDPGLLPASSRDDSLLTLLEEATQGLRELLAPGRTRGVGSQEAEVLPPGQGDPAAPLRQLLGVLRELSVLHTRRVNAWTEALRVAAHTLTHTHTPGETREESADAPVARGRYRDDVGRAVASVAEDVRSVRDTLSVIRRKLDAALASLAGDARESARVHAETTHTHTQAGTEEGPNTHTETATVDSQDASDSQDAPGPGADDTRGRGVRAKEQGTDAGNATAQTARGTSPERRMEGERERERRMERRDGGIKEEAEGARHGWVTLGLRGRSEDRASDVPAACYVTAPAEVIEVMTCDLADRLSSLMVSGSEELVSNVLWIRAPDTARRPFPLSVVVPFRARYRGNYRDITVKVVDREMRVSYVSPVSTEGTYGGQRGSFAEVRVYALGVFAVVSCLRRESFTVPKKGLSLKLSMEPRICLDYLPGCYPTPILAQATVQPIDATLLASVKQRRDGYHGVVSSSPLLLLCHPSSHAPRRPLSLTLPCPPNHDKSRAGDDHTHSHTRPISAVQARDSPSPHRVRAMSAAVKSCRELTNEQLSLLGWRDEQWNVLDHVPVRNLQNGLVSFELMENFERLIVLRLLSSVKPSVLTTLVEEVEDSVRSSMVTIVLQRKRDDPHSVVVAALPSRDLSWELAKLQAQAYCGPPEPSGEISMCEGEQLLLSFRGNITCADKHGASSHRITFHNQKKNRLFLTLTEVDPFGNCSSPHYKGTAIFFRVTRGQLAWRGDRVVMSKERALEEAVCRLSLTLPKTLSLTLCWSGCVGELCEDDAACLCVCLRLRRSAVQLARLRAPDSLARQSFHMLALWRRGLPSHAPKAPLLARCLCRSGRPDLAKELLLRDAAGPGT